MHDRARRAVCDLLARSTGNRGAIRTNAAALLLDAPTVLPGLFGDAPPFLRATCGVMVVAVAVAVDVVNRMVDDIASSSYSSSTIWLTSSEVEVAAVALPQVFAALADPTRLDLVTRLVDGDLAVNELAAPYDISVQAVSKHLRVLEDAGVVSRPGDATRRPVHLEAEVFDLMAGWIERYRRRVEERYRRLDEVLADLPDDVDPLPPVTGPGTTLRRGAAP